MLIRSTRCRTDRRGVTLVELLVVTAIAAVLAAFAVGSYTDHVQRGRRADGLIALLHVQAAQERFRSRQPRYGALAEIGVPVSSADGHYRLALPVRDAEGYDVLASAAGPQSADTLCRHLRLRTRRLSVEYASGPDVGVDNEPAANRRCWQHE